MRIRAKQLLVLLLAFSSLYSTVEHWRSTINFDRGAAAMEAWEARIQPVKEALPIERGVIGFVGEWDVPGVAFSAGDQETEFILTQYTLAPLILVRGTVAEWNVAILSKTAYEKWQATKTGDFEVIPLGHQVYLLRRLNS